MHLLASAHATHDKMKKENLDDFLMYIQDNMSRCTIDAYYGLYN